MLLRLALIFLAGGLGCVLRYLVAGWVQRWGGESFPLGTLTVNVIGCALIGFLATAWTGPVMLREPYRVAILVGLLGGFTTYSTYAWETVTRATDGAFLLAGLNIALSNVVGIGAAWLAARLAMRWYGV